MPTKDQFIYSARRILVPSMTAFRPQIRVQNFCVEGLLFLVLVGTVLSMTHFLSGAESVGRVQLQSMDELEIQMVKEEETSSTLLPFEASDVLTFCLAFVGLMVAAGGGMGGGAILVPLYTLVLGLTPDRAIPLSTVTIFGGAMANMLLNVRKRHPEADRPLVDWDLVLVLEPLTMAGALVGAHLNVLLPDLALIICLAWLLFFTGRKTLLKAFKIYKIETRGWSQVETEEEDEDDGCCCGTFGRSSNTLKQRRNPVLDTDRDCATTQSKANSKRGALENDPSGLSIYDTDPGVDLARYYEILEEERSPKPRTVAIIIGMFLYVLAINIVKGGGGLESPLGIECASSMFWFFEFLIIVIALGVSVYARTYLLNKARQKNRVGYEYLESDVRWDGQSTIVYPILGTGAGLAAGLCGIGGEFINAPLMLSLGVHPAVASATSATMILFTSFTAATSFLFFGVLDLDYAAAGLVLGFLATHTGQTLMTLLLSRTQRNSYIAFAIALVVLLSSISMAVQWVTFMFQSEARHFRGGFCGPHHL